MARICHMSTAHSGADIRIVRKEAVSAARAGHEVFVVIRGPAGSLPVDVQHVSVAPVALGRLGRFVLLGGRVYRLALRQRADLYHFHDPDLLPHGLLLRLMGARVVYDVHEDVPRDILSKAWVPRPLRRALAACFEVFENFAARRMTAITTATPFIGKRFQALNSRTVTINNYPFLGELAPPADIAPERSGFCYVGGISSIRSASEMVDAAALSGQVLHVAGPMETASLEQHLRARPGWSHVRYHGTLDRKRVAQLMASSIGGLVLFHPEPNHVNAQPNKLFEYMSAGLPVIASNFPLWRDIVERHDCGFCVDPLDPAGIAGAMDRLQADPARAQEMGANGRRAVLQHFNWEQEQGKLLHLYAALGCSPSASVA